jgi:hypothetical protein
MTYQDLIAHYGTQQAAAAAIGMSQSTVSDWGTKGIPYLRQVQYQEITRGRLKADPPPPPPVKIQRAARA